MHHLIVFLAQALLILGIGNLVHQAWRGGFAITGGTRMARLLDLFSVRFVLGAAVACPLIAVIGLLHGTGVWSLNGPLTFLGICGWIFAAREWREALSARQEDACWDRVDQLSGVLVAVLLLATFLPLWAPEVRHDPLFYHVQIPQLWLNIGRIVEVPENGHSYFPYGGEMLYLWSLQLDSDSAAKGMHWLCGVAAAGWVARLARMFSMKGSVAAALFLLVPKTAYLMTSTYIDLFTAMFGIAAVWVMARAWRDSWCLRGAVAAGWLIGSAMSTKYTAWPMIGVPYALMIALTSWRRPLVPVLAGAVALVPLLPWAGRNLADCGNPVAPLLVSVFGPVSAVETGLAGSFDNFSKGGDGALGRVLIPLRYAQKLGESCFGVYVLGLLAAALLLLQWKRWSVPPGVLPMGLLLWCGFLAESQAGAGRLDGRYAMASLGPAIVLLLLLLDAFHREVKNDRVVRVLVPLLLVLSFATALTGHVRSMENLNESLTPVWNPQARWDYLEERGIVQSDWPEVERLLSMEPEVGTVLGLNYPSRQRYWVWIQGLRNDFHATARPPKPELEVIAFAMIFHGVTHIYADYNPGFDHHYWHAYLREHTVVIRPGPRPLRRVCNPYEEPGFDAWSEAYVPAGLQGATKFPQEELP